MRRCYNYISSIFNTLDYAIPFTGVLTICLDKFFYGKMFICAMPIHIGIITKMPSYSLLILCQNIFLKFFYIHSIISAIISAFAFSA